MRCLRGIWQRLTSYLCMLESAIALARGTLVSFGDVEEVIEVVKIMTVYGEDKSNGGSQRKRKTDKNHGKEVEKVGREEKGHRDRIGVDLRVMSKRLRGIQRRRSLPGRLWL